MKSISIDNEKYVKATDIARELGYTSDYVGQLCRAEKVTAQLVGRSWYVSEESIRAHKQTRYRNTPIATKETIKTSLATKDLDSQESFSIPVAVGKNPDSTHYAGQKFYSKIAKEEQTSYFSDESELIPNSKLRTGRLSISLGDSKSVTITSDSKEFDFNPTERPEVTFSGSVSVSEVYDEEMEEPPAEADPTPLRPQPTPMEETIPREVPVSTELTSKIKVKHLRTEKKHIHNKLPFEHNTAGILGMRRERIIDRNPIGGTLKIAVPTKEQNVASSGSGVYFVLVSIIVSVMASVLILGLQADVYVEGHSFFTAYTFTFSELVATVYSAW